jgi:hypothetical protein
MNLWSQDVVRVKGIVWVAEAGAGNAQPHVVQRVGLRWSIEPAPTDIDLKTGGGRLVAVMLRGSLDAAALINDLVDAE